MIDKRILNDDNELWHVGLASLGSPSYSMATIAKHWHGELFMYFRSLRFVQMAYSARATKFFTVFINIEINDRHKGIRLSATYDWLSDRTGRREID